jgi:UDP:flavonoid glycosyltransferase YjiC (YdhE family)
MARIVLTTIGSLGDLHPKLALALELRRRGHDPVVCTWVGYQEKVESLGLTFKPLRPNVDPTDRELLRKTMDAGKGPETVIRDIIFPSLRGMYDDLAAACDGADVIVSGEIVYAVPSLVEQTGIKWCSTSLAPMTLFSAEDPSVYPTAEWLEFLRPLPSAFHRALFSVMQLTISGWYDPYKAFRRELGLSESHEPIFRDKFSRNLHLAMFSRALARPRSDWPVSTLQTGFCFFDESSPGEESQEIRDFLDAGEPPIVFTLGSAAVMDAGSFFDESVKAAKSIGKRAILLYGRDNEPPHGLTDDIVGFDYAPFSQVFGRAACVVHQAGVGTTGQVLRAGVPQLIMPFSHDQPDNAARVRRAGVAEIIRRGDYNAETASNALKNILGEPGYSENARRLKQIVDSENGTAIACDAIEEVLR